VIVNTGVVTQVKASETVCASGAVPPTGDGYAGKQSNAKVCPVVTVIVIVKVLSGELSAAAHRASHTELVLPQSARISIVNSASTLVVL
jgi:hypothetical protein